MGYAPNGSGIWHTLHESLKLGETARSQNAKGTSTTLSRLHLNKTLPNSKGKVGDFLGTSKICYVNCMVNVW